jgi:magnesium transporter
VDAVVPGSLQRAIFGKGFRKRPAPGTPPGTVKPHPEAPKPVVTAIGYGIGEEATFEEATMKGLEDIRNLRGAHSFVWVNVDGLGDGDLIQGIGDLFGLHRLALEDVVNTHQRPKVEDYPERLFVVLRMLSKGDQGLDSEQVSLFLGPDFLLTFQERPGDCLDAVRNRIRNAPNLRLKWTPDYLAYAVLDAIIDAYFPLLEDFGEHLEMLEGLILEHARPEQSIGVQRAKRDLLAFRRSAWPLRDALTSLMRDENPLLSDETRVYLRDAHDHVIQVIDLVETLRETALSLHETYMSAVSSRMNEVMKVLTIIATIFIPLTFAAGIYGMNFNPDASPWNMPELNWRWGYPVFLAVMLLTAGGMVAFFVRKGWLGGRKGI